jgi:CheY-like chemotaxis protein
MHVLIADDEKIIAQTLTRAMKKFQHEVTTAFGGIEAIQKLREGPKPDIVLVDYLMPEMSGLEVLAVAKSLHPDLPVAIMTAFGDPETKERLRSRGAALVLEKPFADVFAVVKYLEDLVPKKS